MADYIDREKAEKIIQSITIVDVTSAAYAEAVLFIIRNIPSADVAPVQHGRWVKPVPGDGDPYCSECKAKQLYLPYVGYFYSKYCPYCGAKMDAK